MGLGQVGSGFRVRTNLSYLQQMFVYLLRLCVVVLNYCVHGSNTQPWWAHGWSELAATNAPFQDEAVQTILGMNQKHILFLRPGIFQPPSLPQNFPLLPTSPPPTYLPSPTSLTSFFTHSISKAWESSWAWVAQSFEDM
jgi:hypothetical protein